ncbi:MAG: SUMF1/EgtB/PvdO family nonheme iron enzyme, partial [Verrucomicrobia bacterium]|nr:SUMF1/EgtB/PvdO family nonheme iron enzyme [Verrucomicrobiota bacterium]
AAVPSVPVQSRWVDAPEPTKSSYWGTWFLLLLLAGAAAGAWLGDWGGLRTTVKERLHATGPKLVQPAEKGKNGPTADNQQDRSSEPEKKQDQAPAKTGTEISTGTLIIQLVKNLGAKRPIRFAAQGPATVAEMNLSETGQNNFTLRTGNYIVALTDSSDPPWRIERKVTIDTNQLTSLRLTFEYGELQVTSDPPSAEVIWPSEANSPTQPGTSAKTPFTKRFRSGEIPFTARHRYHADTTVVHSFYPTTVPASGQLHIVLKRTLEPMTNQTWTNGLGTLFLPVGPHLWASSTETTVREFHEFVIATGYDATNGMFSVTSNGWEQIGCSWGKPGFNQAENCPVIGLNWEDANKFCEWMNRREHDQNRLSKHQVYRLPTTNEWFQLAGNEPFPWGADSRQPIGNYSGKEVLDSGWPSPWPILSGHQDHFPRTAPVDAAEFGASPLGFHHLGGNAAEWCDGKVLCGGPWFDGETGNLKGLETTHIEVPRNPAERHDRNGFRAVFWEPESIGK